MNNPYAPPQAYRQDQGGGPAPGAPPPKTGSGLTVLGAFEIILGVLGLLSAPASAFLGKFARDPVSRRIHEVTWSGAFGTYMRGAIVVSMILAVVMIVAGIGVLKTRPWGRTLSLVYGAVAVVMVVVGQIANFAILYPELDRLADEYASNAVARAAVLGGRIGGMVGSVFGLVFPVIVLIVMTRPAVRAKFAGDAVT